MAEYQEKKAIYYQYFFFFLPKKLRFYINFEQILQEFCKIILYFFFFFFFFFFETINQFLAHAHIVGRYYKSVLKF